MRQMFIYADFIVGFIQPYLISETGFWGMPSTKKYYATFLTEPRVFLKSIKN